jgi:hypothetical protein
LTERVPNDVGAQPGERTRLAGIEAFDHPAERAEHELVVVSC